MEQAPEQTPEKDFNFRVAERVGRQVARAREGVGGRRMTAQALANRTAELGHPLDRSVIAKLEKGFRQTITVADLLVLARALDVPPVTLLFSLNEPEVELLPGERRGVWPSLLWLTGEAPYPDPAASDTEPQRWDPPPALALFRQHDQFVREALAAARRAAEHRMQATLSAGDDRAHLEAAADADAQLALSLRGTIRALRRSLRSANHEPPSLPKAFGDLDDEAS
jgi:transcriptional regulator with XRE-family HTH domain